MGDYLDSSFGKAICGRVWANFKSGLREKSRLVFEGIVSLGVGWTALAKCGSPSAAYDFGIETVLVLPTSLAAMIVIHLLWSWATAPRRIYNEQVGIIRGLQKEIADLRGDLEEATRATPRPSLSIEYDQAKHFTRHPSGDVEVRLLLRNNGLGRAVRVRPQIEAVVPETHVKKASSYSTQFNALRLQVVRERLGFDLHDGGIAEVVLIRAPKDSKFFFIEGYSVEGEAGTFRVPRAKYRITVVVNAMNAVGDRKEFVVTPTRGGSISFVAV